VGRHWEGRRHRSREIDAVNPDAEGSERRLFSGWLRGTFYGWVLGFLLVLLLALGGGAAGMGESQFVVGVGMGAGVGFVQGRVSRSWLATPWRWAGASLVGMGSPFVASDLLGLANIEIPFFVPVCVAAGGLLTGWLQGGLLRHLSGRFRWWLVASAAGWVLAAAPAAIAPTARGGPWAALISLARILSGGVILGAVTGGALVWIRRSPRMTEAG
jgi:hypothetical protein